MIGLAVSAVILAGIAAYGIGKGKTGKKEPEAPASVPLKAPPEPAVPEPPTEPERPPVEAAPMAGEGAETPGGSPRKPEKDFLKMSSDCVSTPLGISHEIYNYRAPIDMGGSGITEHVTVLHRWEDKKWVLCIESGTCDHFAVPEWDDTASIQEFELPDELTADLSWDRLMEWLGGADGTEFIRENADSGVSADTIRRLGLAKTRVEGWIRTVNRQARSGWNP